jgi:hypothetical protein
LGGSSGKAALLVDTASNDKTITATRNFRKEYRIISLYLFSGFNTTRAMGGSVKNN